MISLPAPRWRGRPCAFHRHTLREPGKAYPQGWIYLVRMRIQPRDIGARETDSRAED